MDIIQLYKDYGIFYVTEGNKHCREGWVQINCPFCQGSLNYHLGYNIQDDYYVCWRCGWKSTKAVIQEILHVSYKDAEAILAKYEHLIAREDSLYQETKLPPLSYKIIGDLCQKQHIAYLRKRKYDANSLIEEFKLRGTGPYCQLDNINYKHRLVIPVMWGGTEISFITRDITDKHKLRYITCPANREKLNHKHVVFGSPVTFQNSTCIVVEGVFDVFRFGVGAVATFGIKYTHEQVKLLSQRFKQVFIIYDNELTAQQSAHKLCSELNFRGVESSVIEIETDPGDLTQEEANNIKQYVWGL